MPARDAAAFGHLVGRWQPRLLRHARCSTRDAEAARDVAQESWLAIVRGLRTLRDPASFRARALRIVANKARDWVRREDARRRVTRRAEVETAPRDPETKSDVVDRVRANLLELEPDRRCVLTWYYLEEMTVAEIAEAPGPTTPFTRPAGARIRVNSSASAGDSRILRSLSTSG